MYLVRQVSSVQSVGVNSLHKQEDEEEMHLGGSPVVTGGLEEVAAPLS